MEITIEFIKERFSRFNAEYFKGELVTPKFEISHTKNKLGQLCFGYKWDSRKYDWITCNYVIKISDYFIRTQHCVEETILHEMVHLYMRQNNMKDTSAHHGKVFYRIADRINREGGWNIARIHKGEELTPRETNNDGYWVACCWVANKGKYFNFVMNKNKISYFKKLLNDNAKLYPSWFMFHSYDHTTFGNYPKCNRRMRGWYITEEEYAKYKATA